MIIVRTKEEIDEQLNLAQENIDSGESPYFGMTYEQGIVEMFDWLVGNNDVTPMHIWNTIRRRQ